MNPINASYRPYDIENIPANSSDIANCHTEGIAVGIISLNIFIYNRIIISFRFIYGAPSYQTGCFQRQYQKYFVSLKMS